MSSVPFMTRSWLEQRETGRRNRRLVDLQMGWRLAAKTGDRSKLLEIEEKMRLLKQHMQEGV